MDDTFQLLRFVQLERIPLALIVVAIAWIGVRAGDSALQSLGERFTKRRLWFKQLSAIGRFAVVVVVGVLVTTSVFVLTDEVVLAVGGSVALAVGFALKDLLGSLMAGVVLLFDRPFQVGDRVQFGGTYGEVVEIGLRTVRIATLDDNLVSIPNALFLSEAVSSANAGALDQMCVFDFWIGCGQDFDRAMAIVYEAAASSRFAYLKKPLSVVLREGPAPGAERFAVKVTVKVYVLDGRYETELGTDITERVKRAFRAAGVKTAGEIAEAQLRA